MRQIHFQHISRGWTQTSEYLPIPLKDPIYSSPATSVRSPNCYLLINKNLQDHSSPDMSNIWNTSVDQTGKQDIWSDTYPVSDTKKKKKNTENTHHKAFVRMTTHARMQGFGDFASCQDLSGTVFLGYSTEYAHAHRKEAMYFSPRALRGSAW